MKASPKEKMSQVFFPFLNIEMAIDTEAIRLAKEWGLPEDF